MLRVGFVAIVLFVLASGSFWQTRRFGFVNYDDQGYVTGQQELRHGFSAEALRWALTLTYGGYMPLTGLSFAADAGLYGLDPGGYHLTNTVLHALTATLLFLFLWRTTGALWASALTAALFAVHPLRVESVAWISSRKDVLCGVFWMLTLHAYATYTKRPRAGSYALVLLGVCAALLSKPMAVTLPFVLLLLDVWPFARVSAAPWRTREDRRRFAWRALEKAPLLVPVIGISAITVVIQERAGAVSSVEGLPFAVRVANAIVSYAAYLGKTVWPTNLVPLYPFPADGIPALHVLAAAALIAGVTAAVALTAKRAPWAAVGWFWYLGTLVPVIGLVQVGAQAMADRYTYIPQIGVFVIAAWAARAVCVRWPKALPAVAAAAIAAVLACSVMTIRQSAHWRDSLALWTHTAAITPDSVVARSSLGEAYFQLGIIGAARLELEAAVKIRPGHRPALLNLARLDIIAGRYDAAIARCKTLTEHRQLDPDARTTWASALIRLRRYHDALAHLDVALAGDPNHPEALSNRGAVLLLLGRNHEALETLQRAVARSPDDAVVLTNLAAAHFALGHLAEAGRFCDEALRHDPTYEQALALRRTLDATPR